MGGKSGDVSGKMCTFVLHLCGLCAVHLIPKTMIKNKSILPVQEIRNHHPYSKAYDTDEEYARFGTIILKVIRNCRIPDITDDQCTAMAVTLTMYTEDVVADLGIWRGFTDKMKSLYGRYLPFYDIDETAYLRDEPNVEDVTYLLWYALYRTNPELVINPGIPVLRSLGEALHAYISERFESLPINEELKDLLAKGDYTDDFYAQRDMVKWFWLDCYLTAHPMAASAMLEEGKAYAQYMRSDLMGGFYTAECALPYTVWTGPLSCLAQDYLAMTLRANGREDDARKVEGQEFRRLGVYHVEKAEEKVSMSLVGEDGVRLDLTDAELCSPEEDKYASRSMAGMFVKYDGRWYINGNSVWSKDDVAPKEQPKKRRTKKMRLPHYEELMEESKGVPFFYFDTVADCRKFIAGRMEVAESTISIPAKVRDAVLFLPEGGTEYAVLHNMVRCFKDERNPYYDQEFARKHALAAAFKMPGEALRYAIAHGMLPDAAFNSTISFEQGRQLLQDNFDYMARLVMGDKY